MGADELGPGPRLVVVVLLGAGAVTFAVAQLQWLPSFFRGLGSWVIHPSSGLHPAVHIPVGLVRLSLALLVLVVLSYQVVVVIGRHVSLCQDPFVRGGMTVVVGGCMLGFVGTWELALGDVRLWPFIVLAALLATILAVDLRRTSGLRSIRARPRRHRERPSTGGIALAVLCLVVAALCMLHAATQPVTEFDSLIYHAELPKLWYMSAPKPPLIYGPSIGLEISANYPPLWPALGMSLYVLAGTANDLFLRAVSPVLLLALVAVAFGLVRQLFGRRAAYWSVLLLLGTPLVIFYAIWPTNYLLLSQLVTVAVLLLVSATSQRARAPWRLAGIAAGFAALTNFYGWVIVGAGVIVAITLAPIGRWRAVRSFTIGAVAIVGVWLVRNAVDLGDPVYPLATSILHDRGIVASIWSATQAQVRATAQASWQGRGGIGLRIEELSSTFWNRQMTPCGILTGGVVLAYLGVRHQAARVFAIVIGAWLVILLVPGWYFFRALLPIAPLAAAGGGVALASVMRSAVRGRASSPAGGTGGTRRRRFRRTAGAALGVGLAIGTATISVLTALPLAIAAPNEATGYPTTQLTDWATGIRDIGSTYGTLWSAMGGDELAWQWLNEHLGAHGRVATLEARVYYLRDPLSVFYLDGREAAPMLGRPTLPATLQYLESRRIRYVLIPSWASASPVLSLLPLHRYLGGADFPLVASFAPYDRPPMTAVYGVGSARRTYSPGVYTSEDASPPTLDGFLLPPGATADIFASSLQPQQITTVGLEYRSKGSGSFSLVSGGHALVDLALKPSSTWRSANASFVARSPTETLTIKTQGAALAVRGLSIGVEP